MTTQKTAHLHGLIERMFPERRIFIRSDEDTRFIRLRPVTQLVAWVGSSVLLSWTIIASAVLLMDNIGGSSIRDLAVREQALYETRLGEIAAERDNQIKLTAAAQDRFSTALDQISRLQSELLAADARGREMETGMHAVQTSLREAIRDRDAARAKTAQLEAAAAKGTPKIRTDAAHVADVEGTLAYLSDTITDIADKSAASDAKADAATARADQLKRDLALIQERNGRIFSKLEDAVTNSLEPLGKMFASVKLPTDRIIGELKKAYSGKGGPLTPIVFPKDDPASIDRETVRANAILGRLDQLTLYRIAAAKIPFAMPLDVPARSTSPFGVRTDPINGGRRMHDGQDWAAPYGTPVHATADGTVYRAYRSSSYGNVVEIRHFDGFETRYAHLSKILVKQGQKVSRGDVVGDMGSTGRSTGTHLHYEVRRNGEPVNPMTYIKAARNVF